MANNKLSDGVGKKIVEALKKQSEIEINAIPAPSSSKSEEDFSALDSIEVADSISDINPSEDDNFLSDMDTSLNLDNFLSAAESEPFTFEDPIQPQQQAGAGLFGQNPSSSIINESIGAELDNFEVPSNIAVLKKLITQLPSGVSRQTGAQIIRQTMEALGISMKSVLQEAQQLQDSLSTSAKECQNSIQEYKKQIVVLEKQTQNLQRQYSALNELISLFVQTTR